MHETAERMYKVAKIQKGIEGQTELANFLNESPQVVKNWETRGVSKNGIFKIATILNCSAHWIQTGTGLMFEQNGTVKSANEPDIEGALQDDAGVIEYWDVKGSCGGGFLNYEQMPKGYLIKEASFFKKYGIKPTDAFAIYADGDSMADFIIDGDIVIFDKSKTLPISGKIFAIEHPDGLRIKTLRRKIDGSWILESKNIDKTKYPDEGISAAQSGLLKIYGQFVYRQGG